MGVSIHPPVQDVGVPNKLPYFLAFACEENEYLLGVIILALQKVGVFPLVLGTCVLAFYALSVPCCQAPPWGFNTTFHFLPGPQSLQSCYIQNEFCLPAFDGFVSCFLPSRPPLSLFSQKEPLLAFGSWAAPCMHCCLLQPTAAHPGCPAVNAIL